ncbi:glycosyltransferase [Neobacillus niacini]|uniref:glycosyltransferase n=1 Tax=Neobacillus niacini TaxID=86668 RepID=UPI0021CB1462|nr:glycosyltransferase [Neobacillus niacini]MCM3765775.1 glycosyltransferase [Neobacillus niacini]
MRRLKLLLITRDFSKWVHTEPFYLANELSTITDLHIWHQPGNIHNILKDIPFVPDFILIYLYGSAAEFSPPISGLDTLVIPYGIYVEDLHNITDLREGVKKDNIKHIFACYRNAFLDYYPDLADKMKWLPHHVNINIFKDYRLKKDIKMLMMGAVHDGLYPLRHKILQTYSSNSDFVYHPHPGYRDINDNEEVLVKEKYAKELNRAQLFFTDGTFFRYPVLKYLEVLACNTLLLAPDLPELYDLGFRSEKNYVAINEINFVEKAEFYLKNSKERERIAKNGYKLIQKRHTTNIRAKELRDMIIKILEE